MLKIKNDDDIKLMIELLDALKEWSWKEDFPERDNIKHLFYMIEKESNNLMESLEIYLKTE